jgi:acylphosphatase
MRITRNLRLCAWAKPCALLLTLGLMIDWTSKAATPTAAPDTLSGSNAGPVPQATPATALPPVIGQEHAQTNLPSAPASTNDLKRVHAFVSGRVQGVGFRAFTRQSAVGLRLRGWVRNLKDGRVECVAEGPAAELDKLMQAVSKGPASARVDRVERKEEPYTGDFKAFEITE